LDPNIEILGTLYLGGAPIMKSHGKDKGTPPLMQHFTKQVPWLFTRG